MDANEAGPMDFDGGRPVRLHLRRNLGLPAGLETATRRQARHRDRGMDNAYHEYGATLQKELAKRGIEVELRPAMEGIDTLKAMFDDNSAINAGLVKGGFASTLQGRLATAKAREWHDQEPAQDPFRGPALL